MHITNEKSKESEYYTNENIDRFNAAVQAMADNEKIIYCDANILFDDKDGGLDHQYTSDQSHVLGKYYKVWVDWILEQVYI